MATPRRRSEERLATPTSEKFLHQLPALLFQHAANGRGFRVESPGSIFVIPSFLISGTIDDARNLRPSDGSCTHHAGLNGDVERAVRQIFAS